MNNFYTHFYKLLLPLFQHNKYCANGWSTFPSCSNTSKKTSLLQVQRHCEFINQHPKLPSGFENEKFERRVDKIFLPRLFALYWNFCVNVLDMLSTEIISTKNKRWSSYKLLKVLVKWHWWWNLTCVCTIILWTLRSIFSISYGKLSLVLFQAIKYN